MLFQKYRSPVVFRQKNFTLNIWRSFKNNLFKGLLSHIFKTEISKNRAIYNRSVWQFKCNL